MKSGMDEFRRMEADTFQQTPLHNRDNESENEPLFAFDLPSLVDKMKNSPSWKQGELNAMILFKSPFNTIILATLHEETEISSSQTDDSISLHIVEGELIFSCQEESVDLNAGQMLVVHKRADFSLTTRDKTVLLLNIVYDTPVSRERQKSQSGKYSGQYYGK